MTFSYKMLYPGCRVRVRPGHIAEKRIAMNGVQLKLEKGHFFNAYLQILCSKPEREREFDGYA